MSKPSGHFSFFTALLIALAACGAPSTGAAEAEVASVDVVKPERRDVVRWIAIPGSTEPDVALAMYSRVSGFLRDFTLDIGDVVKPGQSIANIDAPELEQDVKLAQAQVASAQADIQAAQANVKTAQAFVQRQHSREHEIDAQEASLKLDVSKAKAEFVKAQRQFERTQKLFADNAATDLERENQELTAGVYQSSVAVAEGKLAVIPSQRATLSREVESAQAAVESAQAAVDAAKGKFGIAEAALRRAEVWLAYTHVVVPPLGVSRQAATARVMNRLVSNGDLITAGTGARSGMQPLIELVVTDPMRVVADVPEAEVGKIGIGTPMRVKFYGMEDKPRAGKIIRLAPSLSAATRTLRVEMDLSNPDGALRGGMLANVEIATGVHKGTFAIPESAVRTGKGGATTIFIAETGKAKRISVNVGYTDHGWEEVSAKDLNENTVVVKNARGGVVDGGPLQWVGN